MRLIGEADKANVADVTRSKAGFHTMLYIFKGSYTKRTNQASMTVTQRESPSDILCLSHYLFNGLLIKVIGDQSS